MKYLWIVLFLTDCMVLASRSYRAHYVQHELFFEVETVMGLRRDGLPLPYSCATVTKRSAPSFRPWGAETSPYRAQNGIEV